MMTLTKQEIEQQLQANGHAPVLINPPQAIAVAPPLVTVTNVARYNPDEAINGHGLRGWLRAGQIIWTFALYHVFIYVYHRGWFVGGKDESEEKHLQWQAQWLSRQLLKLGPTFIKIGQSVSTRADLLPLTYVKELSKLQDSVPAFPHEVAMQTLSASWASR